MKRLQYRFSRRQFLNSLIGGVAVLPAATNQSTAFATAPADRSGGQGSFFKTRGVVLVPDDLTLADWPERAKHAGLTTIGLHHGRSTKIVSDFIRSDRGQQFLEKCRQSGLHVEYELHAVQELLPRELFSKAPELFRVNEKGERSPDYNLCVHSADALDTAAENAVALAKILRPTTHRYFYWGDDGRSWCRCRQCRELSESDQALILENHLLAALRKLDDQAQLAHLAYSNTLSPPKQVKPKPGIFLEYAPINRRYDIPYEAQKGPEAKDSLEALDANLAVFDRASAQVLEYWLDVSRFSKWKKPAVKLPWNEAAFAADLDTYGRRGIQHVTSFAVFLDAEYVARHGEPSELEPYGRRLLAWRPQ